MADINQYGEVIVVFDNVEAVIPSGIASVQLHLSFFRIQLQDQALEFAADYTSVGSIFVLPKSDLVHTFIIITLSPPICRGETEYPHLVLQFETDTVIKTKLSMDANLLKNKYKDILKPSYEEPIAEVLTAILGGLSGTSLTRPGCFRNSENGNTVVCSMKAKLGTKAGLMYPLEEGFFFLSNPPTFISKDEVKYVSFERHGETATCMHYIDLLLRLHDGRKLYFWNIRRGEMRNLYRFISKRGLHIFCVGDPDEDPFYLEEIANDKDGDYDNADGGSSANESDASESRGESHKRKKKKKDPDAPKKPKSAFVFFSQSERADVKTRNPGIAFKDVRRRLGEKWGKMTAKEKEPFLEMARNDRVRYYEAMIHYQTIQDASQLRVRV